MEINGKLIRQNENVQWNHLGRVDAVTSRTEPSRTEGNFDLLGDFCNKNNNGIIKAITNTIFINLAARRSEREGYEGQAAH